MIRLLNAYNYKGDIVLAGTELTPPNEDVLVANGVAEKITLESDGPDYKKAAEEFFKENQELKKLVESLKNQIEELSKPQDGNAADTKAAEANSQALGNLTPETPERATPEATPVPAESNAPGRVKK
jgi:phage shock protein A